MISGREFRPEAERDVVLGHLRGVPEPGVAGEADVAKAAGLGMVTLTRGVPHVLVEG